MKIENKTAYTTRSLRKFFIAGMKEYGLSPDQYKQMCIRVVYVKYKDARYATGYAYYNSYSICMRVPRPVNGTMSDSVREYCAKVLFHEIGHTLGLCHKEMIRCKSICVEFWKTLPLVAKVKHKKEKQDRIAARCTHVQNKVQEIERKILRYQKLLKKWKIKENYYDRKLTNSCPQD